MNVNETILKLVHLPRRFIDLGNVSFYALLEETSYFTVHDKVSEADIREALLRHPECVDDWILYSEDKRSSEGWYLKQNDKGGYVVGLVDSQGRDKRRMVYAERGGACAAFIKHEVDQIRSRAS
jgi:hypothetical protein